jgi:ADP-dependent NAD(P)H-hydrate dehydratase / NAD(P)H-hydrate epimerase
MRTVPVLTPDQARAWDDLARGRERPERALMESAGRAVAQLVLERYGVEALQGTLVACGPGNNGGDGWVAARALHLLGVPVWATEVEPARNPLAQAVREAAIADGVRTVPADGPWPGVALVVDALLGTGASGAPRGAMAQLVQRLVDLSRPVVAVDGPTGLDLGTGVQHGPLRAALSITFGGARRGHLLARDEVGDVVVVDIGLPRPDPAWPVLIGSDWAAERLAPFAADSYKGTRGHVTIVGGAPAMTGAVRMAARAAFGAGAGLVHVVAPDESLVTIRLAEPDVQTVAQPFALPLQPPLLELLQRSDAVIVGPGLGRAPERTAFVLALLEHARAAVVDADALTMLKGEVDVLRRLAAERPIVCTPHVGEFRTLFPDVAHDLETAPWEAAARAAGGHDLTILLKGVPTVVACAAGSLLTVAAGNPGLATGGSGDVLSGLIGALLAQGVDLPDAAAMGAQAMGDAADHAARRNTARAMRPMDVVACLPDVWRAWTRQRLGALPRAPVLHELPAPRES